MKAFIIAILSGLLLTGCVETMVKVVEMEKRSVVDIDPSIIKEPDVPSPPDAQAYRDMSLDEREDALTRFSLKLYEVVEKAAINLGLVRKAIVDQKKIVDEHNAKEADRVEKLKIELEKNK